MRASMFLALPFAATFALSHVAYADTPADPPAVESAGTDVIDVRGGGRVRGRLVDIVPQHHVTLKLDNGEIQTIDWADIDRIQRVSAQAPARASAQAPAAPQEATQESAFDAVTVHIEATKPVTLEMRSEGHWDPACHAPCDMTLPLGTDYRITGKGVAPSSTFRLSGVAGQTVTLKVAPGSAGARAGGVFLTVIGGIGLVGGGFALLSGASDSSFNSGTNEKTMVAGGVVAGVGALLVSIGVALSSANGTTVAQGQPENAPPRADGSAPPATWHRSAPGTPEASTSKRVTVHIESDGPVTLEVLHDGDPVRWDTACVSPCDTSLALDADYRVSLGDAKSKLFRLSGRDGQAITMTVSPASGGAVAAGVVGIVLGGAAILIGALAEVSAIGGRGNDAATGGAIAICLGAVALPLGIVTVALNHRPSVDQVVPKGAPVRDAWRRTPSWREESAADRARPSAISLPILSGTF